ncbi:MAG: NADH-quinone oxidoreductase subunit L [Candidatus Eisenbacteria bacterium]|nr:NADH-quinone oxidoreductase subunit L [Candidatus Latescibacterota bacterium]MBD3302229.1 NADH-quinone oxidoreductase subunit L [Candidatus Eisenbacteria bacterium]
MVTSLVLILLLPLAGFAIQMFFGTRLPRKGDWLSTGLIGISLVLGIVMFIRTLGVFDAGYARQVHWPWIDIGGFRVGMGILFDNLTAVMLMVVGIVSFLVHLFSIGYLHGDVRYSRYFGYLGIFSFSMLGLVLCDNLLALYVFWELVGLSSYLLIGHWFEKKSASDAAKKAFLTTRIGDVGMFIGIMILYAKLGTFRFDEIFAAVADGEIGGSLLTWAGVGLFCGAIGKSAQFPLHVWLPDAMEGPTPVSALIHAATMVAAGVYMVGRLFLLFTPEALLVIAYIGLITAVMAASIAIVQTDIKKALAYSTISQLGYMITALGVGGYTAGLFHLMTHAFFKALLFLGSGSVIHAVHSQEMPDMGGLRKKMPVTFWTFLVATLAISGVPGLSGFFSKDMILGASLAFGMEHSSHLIIFLLLLVTAGVTAFYMFRVVFLTFLGRPRDEERYAHAHESPAVMTIPLTVLAVLAVGSAWGGWFQALVVKPELGQYRTAAVAPAVPGGEHGEAHAGEHHEAVHDETTIPDALHADPEGHETHVAGGDHADHGAAHRAHQIAMITSILAAGLGILLAWLFYGRRLFSAETVRRRLAAVHLLLSKKYYFDEIYAVGVVGTTLWVSRAARAFDTHVVDGAVNGTAWRARGFSWFIGLFDNTVIDGMVNGVAGTVTAWGRQFRRIQTGKIQNYLLGLVAVALILAFVRLVRGF